MTKAEIMRSVGLRTADVASRLNVSESTILNRRRAGTFPEPDGRIGKTVFWSEGLIRAYEDGTWKPEGE
jgi:predicted DNA-binding transcriptional regulator AlpA